MRFARPVLDKLHQDFGAAAGGRADSAAGARTACPPLRLHERLELDDVHYAYPNAERAALNGLTSHRRPAPPSASSAAPAPARPPPST